MRARWASSGAQVGRLPHLKVELAHTSLVSFDELLSLLLEVGHFLPMSEGNAVSAEAVRGRRILSVNPRHQEQASAAGGPVKESAHGMGYSTKNRTVSRKMESQSCFIGRSGDYSRFALPFSDASCCKGLSSMSREVVRSGARSGATYARAFRTSQPEAYPRQLLGPLLGDSDGIAWLAWLLAGIAWLGTGDVRRSRDVADVEAASKCRFGWVLRGERGRPLRTPGLGKSASDI